MKWKSFGEFLKAKGFGKTVPTRQQHKTLIARFNLENGIKPSRPPVRATAKPKLFGKGLKRRSMKAKPATGSRHIQANAPQASCPMIYLPPVDVHIG